MTENELWASIDAAIFSDDNENLLSLVKRMITLKGWVADERTDL